jgi:hypothetical protein
VAVQGKAATGRKAAAPSQPSAPGAAPQPQVKVEPQALDEDFNAKSDGTFPVPSVWHKDSRYGLLVYCGTKRIKMVTMERGYVAVDKVRRDDLGSDETFLELRKQLQAIPDTKENEAQRQPLVKRMEAMWCRADVKHTPERFAAVLSKSQLQKTDAARAYLDRVLGAMDDLLAAKRSAEEDLLS